MISLTRREFDAVSVELTRAWAEAARRDRLAVFRSQAQPVTPTPSRTNAEW